MVVGVEKHRVWGAAELDRRAVGILGRNGWVLGAQELDQRTVRTPRSGGWVLGDSGHGGVRIRASARSKAQKPHAESSVLGGRTTETKKRNGPVIVRKDIGLVPRGLGATGTESEMGDSGVASEAQ